MQTTSTLELETRDDRIRPRMARARRFAKRTVFDVVYLFAVLLTSILDFVVWVTAGSVTLSLLVLIVGVFVWLGAVYVFRWTTWIDRQLAGWIRRRPIRAVYRQPRSGGLLERLRCVTTDPQTWKDFAWLVVNSILGFALAVAAISCTVVVLGYISMPAWWWAIPDPGQQYGTTNLGIYTVTSTPLALLTSAIGLAIAPLVVLLNRGIVTAHSGLAARMLGPSDAQELRERVSELATTRSGAVEAAQDQLERIERDLHDGAQARIVALAMELGMAEEELASNPDAARETVRRARDEALAALSELRDLSRGMRPALLEERGLGTAIEALAERSPLPVTVRLVGQLDRLPETVQSASYFVVAEALTNAAKHSEATRARVSLERGEHGVAVTVEDNGKGGADPSGGGLDGLRKRVEALDGKLGVASPAGGSTVVRAEIPCA